MRLCHSITNVTDLVYLLCGCKITFVVLGNLQINTEIVEKPKCSDSTHLLG